MTSFTFEQLPRKFWREDGRKKMSPRFMERLITTEKMAKMMLTEKKMMMMEKMVQMMSRWVTHGPARCSPGPAQLTKLASGGSAGCSRENIG